ncbi:hypothetical protein X777_15941 [Ooceraea biroi]|uniref:Uncharacterized protein n=1 Tax=Ooceraea biroi TaxID=2015173 RepID=A0A026WTF7_OOCBI|nr:hypothetical protein X777_15941 [Ooceraea biroi]
MKTDMLRFRGGHKMIPLILILHRKIDMSRFRGGHKMIPLIFILHRKIDMSRFRGGHKMIPLILILHRKMKRVFKLEFLRGFNNANYDGAHHVREWLSTDNANAKR